MDRSPPAVSELGQALERIAQALERLAPAPRPAPDLHVADAFVWHPDEDWLAPVAEVNALRLDLMVGIDRQRDTLMENTARFAAGLPANNALLWGSRGMGKSSIVKAVHRAINRTTWPKLALIEIHREDIHSLPRLLGHLRLSDRRAILFCDDLSFDSQDTSYKSLKAMLEGGIEGRPGNVVFYATSNRRHLLAREMIENEQSTAIHAGEAVEEKVSLSDRFGLWLGFHACGQDDYLRMVRLYAEAVGLDMDETRLSAEAREWSITRGSRSGRVAWQFIQDAAGRAGLKVPDLL